MTVITTITMMITLVVKIITISRRRNAATQKCRRRKWRKKSHLDQGGESEAREGWRRGGTRRRSREGRRDLVQGRRWEVKEAVRW